MKNSKQHRVTLVGMGDHIDAMLPNGRELIHKHVVFSGGKRHYELLKPLLPENHTWIEISGKMQQLIAQYRAVNDMILIFTSGDPFFFGFGNTMKRLMPEAIMDVIPWFSSIQRLSHKAQINGSEIKHVTLHGRSWKGLDSALLRNESTIGILTDVKHAPNIIAERLISFGFNNYAFVIGEHLDGEDERITLADTEEVSKMEFAALNSVILRQKEMTIKPVSFVDDFYRTLDGRPGMITKRPFRTLAIQALELSSKSVFWDIGSCTGAIAIESKKMFPELDITAFEIRTECEEIIEENCRKSATPGIQLEIGDFFEKELNGDSPDAVFIGGHGNRLNEMIQRIDTYLLPNGKMVMNTVSESSKATFIKTTKELGYQLESPLIVNINEYNAINVLAATK